MVYQSYCSIKGKMCTAATIYGGCTQSTCTNWAEECPNSISQINSYSSANTPLPDEIIINGIKYRKVDK